VGELIRARRDGRVLEAEMLALVAEGLALPRLEDDLERLADVIDRRGLLGDPQGIVQRKHLHGHPDAQPLGPRRDRARHHDRRREHRPRRREVHLAEPHAVEPPGLGGVHEVEPFAERRGLVAAAADLELHEDSEVHRHECYWLLIFMSS
jgi:hypothetical protein